MLNIIYILIIIFSTSATMGEEVDVCSKPVLCELKVPETKDCNKKIWFFSYIDTDCESQNTKLLIQYQEENSQCRYQKKIAELECDNRSIQQTQAIKSGTYAETTLLKNGDLCVDDSQCLSGYCYPGIYEETKYCLDKEMNCALINSNGVAYSYIYQEGDVKYECYRPDQGRSAWRVLSQ